jgi:hypothetical protein
MWYEYRRAAAQGGEPKKMAEILILVHRHGSFVKPRYFLHEIAGVWHEAGHRIKVAQGPAPRGPRAGPAIKADVAVLHVDLTVVPEDHLEYLRQFPVVINGQVKDISKRAISSNILSAGDAYDGPVIIKTDRNYGGIMEAMLGARGLGQRPTVVWEPKDYPIYQHAREVPAEVWSNPDLVVEKFICERRDGCYCLRTWVFMGDKETNSLSWAKEPIVKSDAVIRREPVAEVPEELRQMRRTLGFDFGKFDYAIVDGRVILYDANRTPAIGNFPREQYLPRIRLLAEGLRMFL